MTKAYVTLSSSDPPALQALACVHCLSWHMTLEASHRLCAAPLNAQHDGIFDKMPPPAMFSEEVAAGSTNQMSTQP